MATQSQSRRLDGATSAKATAPPAPEQQHRLPADVESWPAQRVLEYALAEFPGRVALACSFQKEESVLLDMLFELEPKARVFAIDR